MSSYLLSGIKYCFAGLAGASLLCSCIAPTVAEEDANTQISSESVEQQGKDLRAAFERSYKTLDTRHGDAMHGIDVTDVLTPYISPGTSFKAAEEILKNAGFTIEPHPDLNQAQNLNKSKDWYAVIAHIPFFARGLISRTDLYVDLLPKSPGDYTTVFRPTATFFTDTL